MAKTLKVSHAHIHIIPRYKGDVPKPRGGVRNIIQGRLLKTSVPFINAGCLCVYQNTLCLIEIVIYDFLSLGLSPM